MYIVHIMNSKLIFETLNIVIQLWKLYLNLKIVNFIQKYMFEYKIIIQTMKVIFKHENQCFNSENCYWNSLSIYNI